jgi:hypothetical protein
MAINRIKKAGRVVQMLKDTSKGLLGKSLSRAINQSALDQVEAYNSPNPIPGYKKGGKVKRTGLAKVHKGELVLTAAMTKKLQKLLMK